MALEWPSLLRATCILRHYCVASQAVVPKDVPCCIHQQCCNNKHLHDGYSANYRRTLRKTTLPKRPVLLHSTLNKDTRSHATHSHKHQTALEHVAGFNSQLPYHILRDRHRIALGLRDDLSLVSLPIVPLSLKVIQELQSLTVPNSSPVDHHSTPTSSSSVCNTRSHVPQLQSLSTVPSAGVPSSTEQLLCSEVKTNSALESGGKDLNPQRPTPAQLSFVLLKLREELPEFFSGHHTYEMYDDNLLFENKLTPVPLLVRSRLAYQSCLKLLRMFSISMYSRVKLELLKITKEVDSGEIRARWRVVGVPRLRLRSSEMRVVADGFSTFVVNTDGKIIKHTMDKMMKTPEEKRSVLKWLLQFGLIVGLGTTQSKLEPQACAATTTNKTQSCIVQS